MFIVFATKCKKKGPGWSMGYTFEFHFGNPALTLAQCNPQWIPKGLETLSISDRETNILDIMWSRRIPTYWSLLAEIPTCQFTTRRTDKISESELTQFIANMT